MKIDDQKLDELIKDFYASEIWQKTGHFDLIRNLLSNRGLQANHTPIALCKEMLAKLNENVRLADANILVLFNLEFVDVLINHFGVNPQHITFFADDILEADAARQWYNVNCPADIITYDTILKEIGMPNIKNKFDVVLMNPPYQGQSKGGGRGRNNLLWPMFVKIAFELSLDNGFIAAIHPPKWRKPEDDLFPFMTAQNLLHLEMHGEKDGIKTFGAATPYDWYIMQKKKYEGKTEIVCSDNERKVIDLRKFAFLPNCNLEEVFKLFAKDGESICPIIYSCEYHAALSHMNEKQGEKYKYPCVHSTGKEKVRYFYSSKKNGLFGVPKIIFGYSRHILNAVVDWEGQYGMTEQAMAIPISSQEEGLEIKRALESERFNKLLQKAVRWSQFLIEYKMFRHFRKDFWKDFI